MPVKWINGKLKFTDDSKRIPSLKVKINTDHISQRKASEYNTPLSQWNLKTKKPLKRVKGKLV